MLNKFSSKSKLEVFQNFWLVFIRKVLNNIELAQLDNQTSDHKILKFNINFILFYFNLPPQTVLPAWAYQRAVINLKKQNK